MDHPRSTPRINTLNILVVVACIALLLLLFASCGSTAQPSQTPSPVALLARSLALPADSMHMYDSTYQRTAKLFDDNFMLNTNKPIRQAEQELVWDALANLIPIGTGHLHALRFDFGLEVDTMRFGINVLQLDSTADPAVFNYTLPDTLLAVEQGSLQPYVAADWRKDRQYDNTNPAVYFSRVKVRHKAGGAFVPVDHDEDAQANVLAWDDELMLMHAENSPIHEDSTCFAVLRCISKPDDAGDLRHRISIHLRLRPKGMTTGGYRDLLDNSSDPANLFRMHGADYGNMTPPGYDWYGLPPK